MELFDLIIRNGTIYDGTGSSPFVGDIAINTDTIAAIGSLSSARGQTEIDIDGLAVAPGFINMLSWATESLIEDGLAQSDIRQGVTLEVMGEGWSMGPLNEAMKKEAVKQQGDIKYDIEWTTLGEYLEHLVKRGISPNVASFIGATTVRIHVLGYEDRAPIPQELDEMRSLVRHAMEEGALGLGSALLYTPAFYADTNEMIALAEVTSEYGGIYISHIRNEGNHLIEALDELITIAKEAGIAAEIYHLKASGKSNWNKLEEVIKKVEMNRREGLQITADMYTYTAGGTGLNAVLPPWVGEGGLNVLIERLKNPEIRKRVKREISTSLRSPENILLSGFKNEALKTLTGKTLAEVASMRGKSPEETVMDLIIEDDSRVDAVYFTMSEENIRKKIALPWMSFCSDAGSLSPEGVFLKSNPHPRAYGSFARLLGKYVQEEHIIPLEEAIRRLTSLPARNLKLERRGLLKEGYFADVVVFDPDTLQDHATYDNPHQYSTGMIHVFVNGKQVLKNGEHTDTKPGRIVRGPGWKNKSIGDAA